MTASRLPLPDTVDCTTPRLTVTVRDVVVAAALEPPPPTTAAAPPTATAATAAMATFIALKEVLLHRTREPSRCCAILREASGEPQSFLIADVPMTVSPDSARTAT